MGNHCIDCEICGDDLRGANSNPKCTWTGCPGIVSPHSERVELKKIADQHPQADLKAKAVEILAQLP